MADSHPLLLTISKMAKLLEVHPQTLRLYERHRLIKPSRTRGNTRLYSAYDVEQIRAILHLTRHLGVNLAGVEIVLHMQRKLEKMQQEIEDLRQLLTPSTPPRYSEEKGRQHALVKASPRKLVKVP